MSVFPPEQGTRRSSGTLRGLVAAAAFAWVIGYLLNGQFWDRVVFDALGLDPESRFGEAVHFFVYDSTKILLLLGGIIFIVTVLRSFVTIERTRALLGGRREGIGNVAAAGLGVVTPFCSCSAVPAFIGFVAAGVPLGVTLSFLIASPMVNEVAVILILGMFGWRVAALYVVFGLLVAIGAGYVLGRLRLERWVEPFVFETRLRGELVEASTEMPWEDRLALGWQEVKSIVRRIWPYLLVGIGIGAIIHGWAPEDLFASWAGAGNPFAVPIAVILGIPLYSSAAGVIPLVQALSDKGVALGTALAFMMAVVALSLPEMILLRRVLKP
ncbi:MAG: permease, partial [Acidimicrobiia bacterium]|nr:permease [Acidimicrobiia bacterium]